MKRTVCVLLTGVLTLSLFAGCGKTEEPTVEQAKESPASAPSVTEALAQTQPAAEESGLLWDLHEENPVDDSYDFQRIYPGDFPPTSLSDYFEKNVLPDYVDRWVENGEILEVRLGFGDGAQMKHQGWVLFTGTPKTDTGWNTVDYQGKAAFCRSIHIQETDEKDCYHIPQSGARLPIPGLDDTSYEKYLNRNRQDLHNLWNPTDCTVENIQSAQLYVRELGKTFLLEDREKLDLLGSALSANWDEPNYSAPVGGQPNVLLITLEDGWQFQIETAPDGSPGTDAWSYQYLKMAPSLYELFSVPLEAKGYQKNGDGTVRLVWIWESDLGKFSYEITMNSDSRLLRDQMEGVSALDSYPDYSSTGYTYREDGLLQSRDRETELYHEQHTYEYDDRGNRIRIDHIMDGVPGVSTIVEYDEQNRMTAVIYQEPDGSVSLDANSYFWYDEAGLRHDYRYDEAENRVGDVPPTPDTPMRRNP